MTGMIAWAADRARMVLAFIILSIVIGGFAYASLPKEGEPDIQVPVLIVSTYFPGISAEDSERLLVRPMETELADLDGLDVMSATAAEGAAYVILEFEFGWDKAATLAEVRDAMNSAEANFPEGAEQYHVDEFNFSEFPIVIVNLTGDVPERTMAKVAKDLQDELESMDAVLEAGIAGNRDEMVEVIIDPLRLEAYNVTAGELINVVVNNNQLIAAGEVESENGTFAVKIPSSFDEPRDIYDLPVKVNGDRVVTLGDLAEINLTFEDRTGTARFNGENTVALQVVKRKGFNLIDTVDAVKAKVAENRAAWPEELQAAVHVGTSNDQSRVVGSMVRQLEGSVLTAIALVMIVVLASLGSRAALLVGFAIPTSFLLCFALLAMMGVAISNIVMFGLILAVGMLVDGAIVVVEYADKRIKEGSGPMKAYVEAAQRMFWPVVSSTATTLCAFLPMLFWPGVPGEFMGMLPVTLIFVLSASLVVALIYLPVMGGVAGRLSRLFEGMSDALRARLPWAARAALVPVVLYAMFVAAMQVLNPHYILPPDTAPVAGSLFGGVMFLLSAFAASVALGAAKITFERKRVDAGYRRSPFGHVIHFIAGNPVMPIVTIAAVGFVVWNVMVYFGENNRGTEFFVETEPEQATAYVRARGNLSLMEADELVRQTEEVIMSHPAVINVFSFAGDGGLNTDASGATIPGDTVGQVQFEIIPWEDRPTLSEPILNGLVQREVSAPEFDGDLVIDQLTNALAKLPGFEVEVRPLTQGPASAKPVHLRIKGDDWDTLVANTEIARAKFEETPGLTLIEDSLPLPGIDWQINVDVKKAGRYGADVATVGGMVQLVTRGLMLDTMRVDSSDEEIEIRVRLPEEDRVLSTLDALKVRTDDGLVPLSNFVTREPVAQLASISRVDQKRYFDVKADVLPGIEILQLVPLDEDGNPVESGVLDVGFGYAVSEEDAEKGDPYNVTLVEELGWFASLFRDAETFRYHVPEVAQTIELDLVQGQIDSGNATVRLVQMNSTERIAFLTKWLETSPFDASLEWEWTGDQEEQEESAAFLSTAFMGALGLMFIILLAQFNSIYNSILVLLAVILSTTGVLIGMIVMQQPFSIIMTGTGIVALAGIVVNNNIVLIDTYQEYSRYMPRIEAIVRTAESRIRPVLLTTITTMAGLAPMMFGLSLDFIGGGYTIDSPTALWWKQLATAVVFGLGVATVLTLVVTPSLLALRVWFFAYVMYGLGALARITRGRTSRIAQDWQLHRAAQNIKTPELIWGLDDDAPEGEAKPEPVKQVEAKPAGAEAPDPSPDAPSPASPPLRAAE